MIKVIDNYYVEVQEYGYTAKKNTGRTDKKGEKVYNTIGYYSSVKMAVKGIIKELLHTNLKDKDISLAEAIKEMHELENSMERILSKIPM